MQLGAWLLLGLLLLPRCWGWRLLARHSNAQQALLHAGAHQALPCHSIHTLLLLLLHKDALLLARVHRAAHQQALRLRLHHHLAATLEQHHLASLRCGQQALLHRLHHPQLLPTLLWRHSTRSKHDRRALAL